MTEIADEGAGVMAGPPGGGDSRRGGHVGELRLRRFLLGESLGDKEDQAIAAAAAVNAHLAACVACARRLVALRGEQRAFEERISFDRFAAGIERAVRVPTRVPGARGAAGWWSQIARPGAFLRQHPLGLVSAAASLAALLALVVGLRPLLEGARRPPGSVRDMPSTPQGHDDRDDRDDRDAPPGGLNRTKGGERQSAPVALRIAGAADDPRQRMASDRAPERLAAGERIRVGLQPGGPGFVFVVSVDERGSVSALYPEDADETSLPVRPEPRQPAAAQMGYLPGSFELTGTGSERVIVLLTDQPLELPQVSHAVHAALRQVGGRLGSMPELELGARQFHFMFIKP